MRSIITGVRVANPVALALGVVSIAAGFTGVMIDASTAALEDNITMTRRVVELAAGNLVPADGVVLEARDFFVNQAVLTGETFPVEKPMWPQWKNRLRVFW